MKAQITRYEDWLADTTGRRFACYEDLWRLSLIHISEPTRPY